MRPLRYAVRHDETPPRLVIDLPAHRIAPGVRPLEVFRGGVTGVYPQQVAEQGGSQVEIGLLPGVTHSWSSPSTSTLLVEIRSDPSAHTQPATSEGLRLKGRISGAVSADRSVSPPKGKETFTLGRTTPGNAERATEVIGIAVEPSGDRTLVRVIGNGPILVYKTERPTHPSQFVLSLPSLTTALSGQSLDTSTPHLKQVTVRPPDTEGTTIEMTLGSGVAPQIVRDGAQVVVEVAGRPVEQRCAEHGAWSPPDAGFSTESAGRGYPRSIDAGPAPWRQPDRPRKAPRSTPVSVSRSISNRPT